MEAAPRLPMVSFELKHSTEHASFAAKLKQVSVLVIQFDISCFGPQPFSYRPLFKDIASSYLLYNDESLTIDCCFKWMFTTFYGDVSYMKN